jgi:hypothetical protein
MSQHTKRGCLKRRRPLFVFADVPAAPPLQGTPATVG